MKTKYERLKRKVEITRLQENKFFDLLEKVSSYLLKISHKTKLEKTTVTLEDMPESFPK